VQQHFAHEVHVKSNTVPRPARFRTIIRMQGSGRQPQKVRNRARNKRSHCGIYMVDTICLVRSRRVHVPHFGAPFGYLLGPCLATLGPSCRILGASGTAKHANPKTINPGPRGEPRPPWVIWGRGPVRVNGWTLDKASPLSIDTSAGAIPCIDKGGPCQVSKASGALTRESLVSAAWRLLTGAWPRTGQYDNVKTI